MKHCDLPPRDDINSPSPIFYSHGPTFGGGSVIDLHEVGPHNGLPPSPCGSDDFDHHHPHHHPHHPPNFSRYSGTTTPLTSASSLLEGHSGDGLMHVNMNGAGPGTPQGGGGGGGPGTPNPGNGPNPMLSASGGPPTGLGFGGNPAMGPGSMGPGSMGPGGMGPIGMGMGPAGGMGPIGPLAGMHMTNGIRCCAGCGVKISDRFLLYALDRYWHTACLKCSYCSANLADIGASCFTRAGMILCKPDYIRLFGNSGACSSCGQVIPANEFVMRAQGNVYHLKCFACVKCHNPLVPGDRYNLINGNLLCEQDCHKMLKGAGPLSNPGTPTGPPNSGPGSGGPPPPTTGPGRKGKGRGAGGEGRQTKLSKAAAAAQAAAQAQAAAAVAAAAAAHAQNSGMSNMGNSMGNMPGPPNAMDLNQGPFI